MKTNDEFDGILEDALAEYREAEPLAGLEGRVLLRLQERTRQRSVWWRWTLAASLAMALLFIAVWFEFRDQPYRPSPRYQASTKQASRVPNTESNLAKSRPDVPESGPNDIRVRQGPASSKSKSAAAVTQERHKEFPTPAPLTAEERALLALARVNPEALRTLPDKDTALAIAPITIQPLAGKAGNDEGDN